jgi:hypothetical protein
MGALLAEAAAAGAGDPSPTVITALVGTVLALSGLVGWLVRQGRADVRDLVEAAAKERADEADRRDRNQTEVNKVLGQVTAKLAKVGQAMHELAVADGLIRDGLADVVGRLDRLEDRTGEHRPVD